MEEARTLSLTEIKNMGAIFGVQDRMLRLMEETFNVTVQVRNERIKIEGEEQDTKQVLELIKIFDQLINQNRLLTEDEMKKAMELAKEGRLEDFLSFSGQLIGKTYEGKDIRPKSLGQDQYLKSIQRHTVTFGIGPAGTGKTFLAVTLAASALKKGEVKRIVVTRPAVEAGESLGFLPGDLKEKVDPYLRPVYDALHTIYGTEHTDRLIERQVIEIAPLAYMRGRTLDDAFVILDEAQNTTVSQMKMFLTRLGFQSKMVINGDTSQIDLPYKVRSGLLDAQETLKDIKDIDFVYFSASDVVRHPVVAAIIQAYEKKAKERSLRERKEEED